ncbi:MAG: DUF1553 domain-containing protein [Planctomycetota bacterium]|nr:DUF1553 domain-containing protein [Planctomycetota bacterium]
MIALSDSPNNTRFRLLARIVVAVFVVLSHRQIYADAPSSTGPTTHQPVNYLQQIKPLLASRCYACHGSLKEKSGLRLDTAKSMKQGGESGPAIVPGDADASEVIRRTTTDDISERMPPEGEGEPLTVQEVELLRLWIANGASAPDDEKPEPDARQHWSFRPRVRPSVPQVSRDAQLRNPIDSFIADQFDRYGLVAQPEASRSVLIRRLYLDLVGVPPTTDEFDRCFSDVSAQWYEALVDRLLIDPRHADRWARHWMDIWRYADGSGLGTELRTSHDNVWHWLDWIVESLKSDVPYDEMVRQMLAADEIYPDDLQKVRATGFLARNYSRFSRTQWMEETVEHVGKGFLGMTFNCARCHDHKYDPIEQVDYYKMRAFFEPYLVRVDLLPSDVDLSRGGVPRVYDASLTVPTYLLVRGQENNPLRENPVQPGVPRIFEFMTCAVEPLQLPTEAYQPERRPWLLDVHLQSAKAKLATAESAARQAQQELAEKKVKQKAEENIEKKAEKRAEKESTDENKSNDLDVEEAFIGLRLAIAQAEFVSVERRVAATIARKALSSGELTEGILPEPAHSQALAACQAERQVTVLQAQYAVEEAEQKLKSAEPDKKKPIEESLATLRESLAKAILERDQPTEQFSGLGGGATRVETRFINNQGPDPVEEFPTQSSGRRTALARWITDPTNPLTARVAANHFWARHMGAPLVATTFEFGRKGTPPSHPELLDWLASELVESGWSMKHLHRMIVTSAAYRRTTSVAGAQANLQKDPDNRYWWRRTPIRLESQVIRDSILAISGEIDFTQGGQPIASENQAASTRRSVYFVHSGNDRNLFLSMFDDASAIECYRRDESIVPQQALALSNSRLVYDASLRIAERLTASIPPAEHTETDFIRAAFRLVLNTEPSREELLACSDAMATWHSLPDVAQDARPDFRCRCNLVRTLLNDNDFVTLR